MSDEEVYINPLTNRMVKKGTYSYRTMIRQLSAQDRLGDLHVAPNEFRKSAKSESVYKKSSDIKKVVPKNKYPASDTSSSDSDSSSTDDDGEDYADIMNLYIQLQQPIPEPVKEPVKEQEPVHVKAPQESSEDSYTYAYESASDDFSDEQ